ncbi:MAG: hemerythrin domain-containing protein [Candidatus Dormibacteria bacterium]
MGERVAYQTDTSDMFIPHGLFRTALASSDGVIAAVAAGDRQQSAVVGSYFDNLLRFLDAHHGGEDALLWPVLSRRCPEAAELLERMEGEHQAIDRARHTAGDHLQGWTQSADPEFGRDLAQSLRDLRRELEAHLGEEEREILPLASKNVSPEEWGALPGHAMAHFTGDKPWLVLGLIFEQMTPEQLALTTKMLPPPVVEMWTTTGRAAFDSYIAQVGRNL